LKLELDISKVMELLPHRYPFLLIDRVVDEPFFQGHFPNQPIMPGVLILEALAQATGLLAFSDMGDGHETKLYMLVGIDKARFRGQVVPGDQLLLNIGLKRNMRGIGMYQCKAMVDGAVVAEAEMMCSAQERQQ
jgi:3-hydroxyacyl-[acyl-carrier-protein] dehydratase